MLFLKPLGILGDGDLLEEHHWGMTEYYTWFLV